MKTSAWMLALCIMAFSGIGFQPAFAESLAPDQLVKVTADKVLSEVQANRKALEDDTSKIYDLVNRYILPHFDFEKMSRSVLGKHWHSASAEEQKGFIKQFQMLLVRTYAVALLNYSNQAIEYLPFRLTDGANVAVVKTKVSDGNSPPLPIDYLLHNSDAWKVVDVKIDGISLVSNYRTSFAQQIRQGGVGGLVKQLAARNNYLEQSASGASSEPPAEAEATSATKPAEPIEEAKPKRTEPAVAEKPAPQGAEKKTESATPAKAQETRTTKTDKKDPAIKTEVTNKDEPKAKITDKQEKKPVANNTEEKKPAPEKKEKASEATKATEKAVAATKTGETPKPTAEAGTKTTAKDAETAKAAEVAAEGSPPPPPPKPKKSGFVDL